MLLLLGIAGSQAQKPDGLPIEFTGGSAPCFLNDDVSFDGPYFTFSPEGFPISGFPISGFPDPVRRSRISIRLRPSLRGVDLHQLPGGRASV